MRELLITFTVTVAANVAAWIICRLIERWRNR